MKTIKAIYNEAILPEHKGNPLIEALPPKLPWLNVMELFSHYPDYAEEISDHPDPLVRDEYLVRIDRLRQPLTDYQTCFRAIERSLKNGYSTKNPLTPTTAQYLHYFVDEQPEIEPDSGRFTPKGEGLTLIGESGIGKTTMLEQVLSYFPNVIVHDGYKGTNLDFSKQVVWVKVDCPQNSSVRDLCEEILWSLDLSLDRPRTRPEKLIGSLIRQIEQVMKASFLGMLVIDEMQNLTFKKTKGEDNLLKFLHRLVNKLGIPIFFCANPPFNLSLIKELKNARRAESCYHYHMSPLSIDSDSWKVFIQQLWNYQWTNVFTELTDELNKKIFELSVGNIDMACRTFREAQRLLIGSVDERLTKASLEAGNAIACSLSRQTQQVIDLKTAITLPVGKKRTQKVQSNSNSMKVDKTGDVSKPQHSEFAVQIQELMGLVDLSNEIEDMDLMQRSKNFESQMEYLSHAGVLLEDPLSEFG
ncbi:ATP-binding protein [Thalassotalea nanhaiensis]|uniref:ATP-binding protein n=1 Tax=Thalassotalea nanhaiensis TaxID=3065648 RepID=A0ABY9TJ48_9GAMM|nr:ATP-binding protein [Colwelliaceae bacterium SQ345]